MLTEKSKLIANNREISNVMNNYFAEITKRLNVKVKVICHSHPLENIIDAFNSHENIDQIKLQTSTAMKFSIFAMQTKKEVNERILNLPSKKATRISDIHAKVLKANNDIYLKDLTALKMMEIWKKHLDKKDRVGVILMDLFKALDTVNHICSWLG